MISVDDDLFAELLKYVEGSLPVHKRVGGAAHRDSLIKRLSQAKQIRRESVLDKFLLKLESESEEIVPVPAALDEPQTEEEALAAFEEAQDFFQRLEE
jgi:hypothetical protein